MSTTYEEGLEPNLHLSALRSRMDRSRQATYEGKPQRKTINDRKSHNQVLEAVFVNHALASTSWVPNKPKYYFSLCGTLPP
jgi:hypothetical protein